MNIALIKKGVIGIIVSILILTVLEFPAPVGFETRPQDNVSLVWLFFFLIILITEIAVIPIIRKSVRLGAKIGIVAAILNILQVVADQTNLMQPEAASLGYLILEDTVVAFSLVLGFLSWKILIATKAKTSAN